MSKLKDAAITLAIVIVALFIYSWIRGWMGKKNATT